MNLKEQILKIYSEFFIDCKIDNVTGIVESTNKRFATFPSIGEKYEGSKKKILIVGLDIGSDEYIKSNTYQTIEDRRKSVCRESVFNPHIAGTYSTALYFLKDLYGWENLWNEIKNFPTSQQATKIQRHKNGENPLAYISLTNFYKFVQVQRLNKAGDLDRKFISKDIEREFFITEVKVLNPDVIIFQGKPDNHILENLKTLNKEIFIAPHPSYRTRGGRKADTYLSKFCPKLDVF